MKARQDYRLVHKLIRKTAKDMAGHYYEFAAHDNLFYHFYPSERFFIDYEWAKFIHVAKQTLTDCLRSGGLTDKEKAEVYDALCLDATLPYSEQETQIINIPH